MPCCQHGHLAISWIGNICGYLQLDLMILMLVENKFHKDQAS